MQAIVLKSCIEIDKNLKFSQFQPAHCSSVLNIRTKIMVLLNA